MRRIVAQMLCTRKAQICADPCKATCGADRTQATIVGATSYAALDAQPGPKLWAQGGSRVRELRMLGSVRGVLSNGRPYRDPSPLGPLSRWASVQCEIRRHQRRHFLAPPGAAARLPKAIRDLMI